MDEPATVLKRLAPVLVLAIAACASPYQAGSGVQRADGISRDNRESAVAQAANAMQQLRDEASRLAHLVKQDGMSKTEAADALNAKRLSLVGSNPVDDDVFNAYRDIAVLRDGGKLSQSNAQSRMLTRLGEARKRYRQTNQKQVPVFSNFMMELYHLPPL